MSETKVTNNEINNPYKFRVYRNAAANTGSGTFAQIVFDTELFDTNNNFTSGNYIVPVTGYYQFSWTAGATSSSTSQLVVSALYNGSTEVQRGNQVPITVNGTTYSSGGSALVFCTAGDSMNIRIYGSVTLPLVTNQSECVFSGHLISL